ncbi:MAG TPA: DUF1348 family protein [Streptosporangiaceae bacterium]
MTARPPVPPFEREAAIEKVQLAKDSWNTRNLIPENGQAAS